MNGNGSVVEATEPLSLEPVPIGCKHNLRIETNRGQERSLRDEQKTAKLWKGKEP